MDTVQTDIQRIIENKVLFEDLSNATVLITGATGFIGSMLAKTFIAANKRYGLGIKIIGLIRDYYKAESVFGSLIKEIDLTTVDDIPANYIIHTVSPTASRYFIEHPVETIRASVESTISILESAKKNGASVVYLSSMEQYGVPYESNQRMTEDKVGIIDHLSVRSSYSESKRLCECLCASYAAEYGVDVKIARLAQTIGSGVPLPDNRMPMQFVRSVIDGRDIVLHTDGKSIINFVYITDAITGILTILKKGLKGQAYNICNDQETRSVREIADLVCHEVAKDRIQVQIDKKEDMGYAPEVQMYLDSGKLNTLDWKAEVGMSEAYDRLRAYFGEL